VPTWGVLWLALAAVMAIALLRHRRSTFIAALSTNAAAWFLWGLLIGSAVFTQPNVTPLAGVQSWFIAVASTASMLSLLWGEVR
jgi:hypothetical protein